MVHRDILLGMKDNESGSVPYMVKQAQNKLDDTGLGGIVKALSEAFLPLKPIMAQMMWFLQPAFGLFGQADEAESLAKYFDAESFDSTHNHLSDKGKEDA